MFFFLVKLYFLFSSGLICVFFFFGFVVTVASEITIPYTPKCIKHWPFFQIESLELIAKQNHEIMNNNNVSIKIFLSLIHLVQKEKKFSIHLLLFWLFWVSIFFHIYDNNNNNKQSSFDIFFCIEFWFVFLSSFGKLE